MFLPMAARHWLPSPSTAHAQVTAVRVKARFVVPAGGSVTSFVARWLSGQVPTGPPQGGVSRLAWPSSARRVGRRPGLGFRLGPDPVLRSDVYIFRKVDACHRPKYMGLPGVIERRIREPVPGIEGRSHQNQRRSRDLCLSHLLSYRRQGSP